MAKVVEVHGLSYSYPDPHPVLEDFDLELAEGETVGIVGPNGAGKTTLFLVLAGILSPQEGSVSLLGKTAGEPDLRGRVALVLQSVDDQLFSTTVFDDVAFGPLNLGVPRGEVESRVTAALAAVGLSGFEQRVPHHLSGGEKRKVALAAVLSMQPEVFLLDEPSSDLDSSSRRELVELLRSIPEAKLIASHDFELIVEVADRVAILHEGRIQASGDPLTLLSDEPRMRSHALEVPRGILAWKQLKALGKDILSG